MISVEELRTAKNPAILENPPTTANKNMIDLLRNNTGIGVPSPAMPLRMLIPSASDPKSPTLCKVKKPSAVLALILDFGSKSVFGEICHWSAAGVAQPVQRTANLTVARGQGRAASTASTGGAGTVVASYPM